jgi:hypothetical protein
MVEVGSYPAKARLAELLRRVEQIRRADPRATHDRRLVAAGQGEAIQPFTP